MAQSETLRMTEGNRSWFERNNAQVTSNTADLNLLAGLLGVRIDPRASMYLSSEHLPSDESHIMATWSAPRGPLVLPGHQSEITGAVGVALLEIKQAARRRIVNLVGVTALFVGAAVGGAGERYVNSEYMHWGGWTVTGIAVAALSYINTRGRPRAPVVDERVAPIRIERLDDI